MSPNSDTETLEPDARHRGCCTAGTRHRAHESCIPTRAESRTATDRQRWRADAPDGLSHNINFVRYLRQVRYTRYKKCGYQQCWLKR